MLESKLDSFSATYETEFRVPIFDLGAKHPIFVESLYRRVARHWIPDLSDFKVISTGGGLESTIRLSLFRGSCLVSLSPTKLVVDFRDAVSSDLKTILDVTASVLEAVSDNIGVDMFGVEWAKVSATIDLGSEANVVEFLSSSLPSQLRRQPIGMSGAIEHGGLKIDYEMPGVWNCGVDISRRWGKGNEGRVFLSAHSSFNPLRKGESSSDSLQRVLARVDVLRSVVMDVLQRVGLSLARDGDLNTEVAKN